MSREAWQQRHCDNVEVWKNLVITDFPEDQDKFSSPLIYRDFLLTLEKDQGFLFICEDTNIMSFIDIFYIDYCGQPQILSIAQYPYGKPYIDFNRTLWDVVLDLITKTTIYIEEEATNLGDILTKYNKHHQFFELSKRGSQLNTEHQVKRRFAQYPQPTMNTLSKEIKMMYWQLGGNKYSEVALLKLPGRFLLVAPSRGEKNFSYLVGDLLEDLCYPLYELFFLE